MPIRKIILALTLMLLFHTGLFTASLFLFRIPPWAHLAYYIASGSYATLTTAALLRLQDTLRYLPSGAPLRRLNTANLLSLFRLSAIPTILGFLIVAQEVKRIYIILLPYIAVVFLSDFFDGFIARKRKEQSQFGKYLDSSSDYLMLFGFTGSYLYTKAVPSWFALLVLFRLLLQTLWIIIVYAKWKSLEHKSTFLGKAAVFSIMFVYAFELFELFSFPWIGNSTAVTILEWTSGAVVFASIFDKLILMRRPKMEEK